MNANGAISFFLSDHLGSTAITVEDDGDFHGELRYSAWGETREEIGETPINACYTGQYSENLLGIIFFEARWFDPGLGRFLSPDSLVPDPYNSLDWNRYAYVRNNSINFNDPSGHVCSDPEDPTPTCESGEVHPVIKRNTDQDWKNLIKRKFGITLSDQQGKWDALNIKIIYSGLSQIDGLLAGRTSSYVTGSIFYLASSATGTYSGLTSTSGHK